MVKHFAFHLLCNHKHLTLHSGGDSQSIHHGFLHLSYHILSADDNSVHKSFVARSLELLASVLTAKILFKAKLLYPYIWYLSGISKSTIYHLYIGVVEQQGQRPKMRQRAFTDVVYTFPIYHNRHICVQMRAYSLINFHVVPVWNKFSKELSDALIYWNLMNQCMQLKLICWRLHV